MNHPNLFDLKSKVPKDVVKDAELFARAEANEWPYATYHPNDLTTMFEKGYLAGFLKGVGDCIHPGCCCVCGHEGKCPEDGPSLVSNFVD